MRPEGDNPPEKKTTLDVSCLFVLHTGTSLGGEVDPSAVLRLNLPTFDPMGQPPLSEMSGAKKGMEEKAVRKEKQDVVPFMMGETPWWYQQNWSKEF